MTADEIKALAKQYGKIIYEALIQAQIHPAYKNMPINVQVHYCELTIAEQICQVIGDILLKIAIEESVEAVKNPQLVVEDADRKDTPVS
jgi:hypothetical protein